MHEGNRTVNDHSSRSRVFRGKQLKIEGCRDVCYGSIGSNFGPNLLLVFGIYICWQDVPSVETLVIRRLQDEWSDLVWRKAKRFGVIQVTEVASVEFVCIQCTDDRVTVSEQPGEGGIEAALTIFACSDAAARPAEGHTARLRWLRPELPFREPFAVIKLAYRVADDPPTASSIPISYSARPYHDVRR